MIEYKSKCDLCKFEGSEMYARLFYRPLNGKWKYLCSSCWENKSTKLRNHSRDTMGFALKATYVEVNGVPREIEKDPVTDHGKKSHKGLLCLSCSDSMGYVTLDQCTPETESSGLLKTVFKNGQITSYTSLNEVRAIVEKSR